MTTCSDRGHVWHRWNGSNLASCLVCKATAGWWLAIVRCWVTKDTHD